MDYCLCGHEKCHHDKDGCFVVEPTEDGEAFEDCPCVEFVSTGEKLAD